MSRAWRIAVTTWSRRVASPRKAARVRCRRSWRRERGARQGQQVPGPAGAEGRHQGDGADLRDTEEPFEIAADEEVAVERFELADGVGDGEEPPGLGWHRGAPCRLHPLRRGARWDDVLAARSCARG